MIRLEEVNQHNWLQAVSLSVSDEQKGFLDSAKGIIARGYIYRDCRARVWAVTDGHTVVGLAMVRDLDEEPACYELQQFMIDHRYQNMGYGTAALAEMIRILAAERKYPRIEVCVNKNDHAAIHVYAKAGFEDSGYIDEAVPDSLNLVREI